MPNSLITLGVFFGGKSQEHEISLISARNVIHHLDRTRYRIIAIGIDRLGQWWWQKNTDCLQSITTPQSITLDQNARPVALVPGNKASLITLDTPAETITLDVAFPILHGPYGEDGIIQGMLAGVNVACVGANTLTSAVCMNKYLFKCLLDAAGLPCGKFQTLKQHQYTGNDAQLQTILSTLGSPCFVKPVDLGSSIAIHKVNSVEQLKKAIEDAFQYTQQLIFEAFTPGREIECAVLGNDHPQAALPAEIHTEHDFYSYAAKYLDKNGATLSVPAQLSEAVQQRIQALAVNVYQLVNCCGLARVDFFLTPNEHLIINEINTIPGFTPISLFPQMWAHSGLQFSDLLNKLIDLALAKAEQQSKLKIDYVPS